MAAALHDRRTVTMKWLRLLGIAILLLVLIVAGSWHWLLHTESGARWVWAQAQSASKEALQMSSLSGNLGSGVTINNVVFRSESATAEIGQFRFAANLDLFPLRLHIGDVAAQEVTVRLSGTGGDRKADESAFALERLTLPLPVRIGDSVATSISVAGPAPAKAFEIRQLGFAGSWHETIVLDYLNADWDESTARLAGDLQLQQPYAVTINGQLSNLAIAEERIEPLEVELQAIGSLQKLKIDLAADNSDLEVSGQGELHLVDDWSIDANLNLASFNINSLLPQWPTENVAHGELSVVLSSAQLVINDSWLAVAATDTTLHVDGRFDRVSATTQGDLRWSNFVWPAAEGGSSVYSDSGSVSLAGSPDDWQVEGSIALRSDLIPPGQFQIDGSGDRDHLQATILESEILGGNLAGSIGFTWRDDQAWSASLSTSNLQLTALNPRWPSNVSGKIDAKGTQTPLLRDVTLDNVSGDLWALPITANGQLVLTEQNIVAREIRVAHGETRIELDGDLRSREGVEFDASTDDIGLYLVNANGAFDIGGQLSLNRDNPFIDVTGVGSDAGFGQLHAASIEIRNRPDANCSISTELIAPLLSVAGNEFEDVTLALCGDQQRQHIVMATTYDEVDVQIGVEGSFDDFALLDTWRGKLQQFAVSLAGERTAELTTPTPVTLSATTALVERTCLSGDSDMQLCATLDWTADVHTEFDADMTDVPLALVNQFIPTELQFNQSASGQIRWSDSIAEGTNGKAEITLTAGSIVSANDSDISIPTDPGQLFFEIIDGRTLAGSAAVPMPGFGRIDATMSIPDIGEGSDGAIEGSIDVELSDMTLLAAVVPVIEEARGFFSADIEISGSLVDPRLVGEFSVADGSLMFSVLGARLEQINLESTLFDDGQIELTGEFLSGDGRAEIFTRSDYANTGAKGFELELRGQGLTLIDVPDIKARADVDLRVNYDYQQLTLGGNILIPHARVKATKLAVAQDTESEDVVFVGGELPADDKVSEAETDLQISGSVGLALGDDVSMDLGLATANLTGNTLFTWQDGLIPLADGRYDLTGTVQAFGQTLEITNGGLRFPKIPADDPFVRLRAEREIYGNSQVKTAGVLVDGRLRQFSIEAYTRPSTTEERALTLLVTGSDFDFEQGVGAIDFGTYIAPRVFVSYGVGLFETENVIRVRYDLKRGFGVTASSGEKESGLDLSYRIER
ncbi:MAG: translocation/assembly module TamB domain-containing protein [Woeseiaceae bacterium]